jgi:hypothetical protein
MPRTRQAVSVVVALVGLQDTTVVAHRPGTDGAAVSVRVGGALVYMHDAATVSSVARTWNTIASTARLLPREGDAKRVEPVRGVADPSVMVELADSPAVFARMERPPGRNSYLRVALGRMMFDVRDVGAYSSTLMAFRRAEELAATAFLPTRAVSAREQAARAAARAFTVPASAPRRSLPSPRRAAAPAAARPSRLAAGRAM